MGVDEKRNWFPEGLAGWLQGDPWGSRGGDPEAAEVGSRAHFRPDGTTVVVTAAGPGGVTARVVGPADAPDLWEERTVSAAEWAGMFSEGTMLHLPEAPQRGEAWTNARWELWFVREVSDGEVMFEDFGGETLRCGLAPDGQPDDGGGWFRVNLDTEGESRKSWEGY